MAKQWQARTEDSKRIWGRKKPVDKRKFQKGALSVALIESLIASQIAAIPDNSRTDEEIIALAKPVAQACIDLLPPDQIRTDLEINQLAKAVAEACVAENVRTDEEIKCIAEKCFNVLAADFLTSSQIYTYIAEQIDALPEDQVRSDDDIIAISKQVTEECLALQVDQVRSDEEIELLSKAVALACIAQIPPDETLSDTEIKTIAEQCFNTLSAQFLTATEIHTYIEERLANVVDNVRTDSEISALASVVVKECLAQYDDKVRTDLEIQGIANQVFKSCLALLPEDATRTDLEIMALSKTVFNECIQNIDFGDTGITYEQAESIAKTQFLVCINDYVRSESEVVDIVREYVNGLELNNVSLDDVKEVAQDCIDLLPADQVRTDSEIKAIAQACLDAWAEANPDQVRTDAEIKAIVQACIDALPEDQVRTDTEITNIANAAIENHPWVRDDDDLKDFVQACVSEFVGPEVTPRTDAEIEAIAQALIDMLPPDQVRNDAEIKAIAQACVDAYAADQDTVRTDDEINALAKIVAQACIDSFVQNNPDQVRTDAEINALAKTVSQTCINEYFADNPDQVRTDPEIISLITPRLPKTNSETCSINGETFSSTTVDANGDYVPAKSANQCLISSIQNTNTVCSSRMCCTVKVSGIIKSEPDRVVCLKPVVNGTVLDCPIIRHKEQSGGDEDAFAMSFKVCEPTLVAPLGVRTNHTVCFQVEAGEVQLDNWEVDCELTPHAA